MLFRSANNVRCACTNSVHAVRFLPGTEIADIQAAWATSFCQLSCEIEGHPLGGGMLKLEPGEAANVRVPLGGLSLSKVDATTLDEAVVEARRWRHYA